MRLSKPGPGEKYGDILVDTNRSQEIFRQWNQWAKERETHPEGLRRPLHLNRPLAPERESWYLPE